jgi:hypothetical protein
MLCETGHVLFKVGEAKSKQAHCSNSYAVQQLLAGIPETALCVFD